MVNFHLIGDYYYYYDLAVAHEPLISAFVVLTRFWHEHPSQLLPHRRETIFHQPFGVARAARLRSEGLGHLRLLFVGRLDRAKGAHLLSGIDAQLHRSGIAARWTVVGDGPCAAEARTGWVEPTSALWLGARSNPEVLSLYAHHAVLVLPSRAERWPRGVLAATSAVGCRVVTDLPCG